MLASLVMLRSILFRQAGRMRGGVRGLVQINAANTTSTASIIRFLNPARSIHGIVCSSMSASFIALHFYSANSQSSRSPIEIAKEAEKMYGTNPKAIYDMLNSYLQNGGVRHAEILWRYARACRDVAIELEDKEARKALIFEGFEAAKEAVQLDPSSFGSHKWVAIMMNAVGEYLGSKQQLIDSYQIREHFQRACELNPTDATSRHLLGIWCFTFADMPWYQRKLAGAVLAKPPTSSYEETLSLFLKAEELEPGFYTKNAMYLGKTYLRMGNSSEAKEWLKKCLSMPVVNEDDREAQSEAQTLLKGI
eukprot:gene2421-5362_t